METSKFATLVVCLSCIVAVTRAQFGGAGFSPLLLGALGGEDLFEGGGGGSIFLIQAIQQLSQRLQSLEIGVRTGAIGGCESGVIGPFSALQSTATIAFQHRFLTPPSVSLSLSDLTTANVALPVSFAIRPTSVTNSAVTVAFADTTNNVAQAYVSYMACPSKVQSNNCCN